MLRKFFFQISPILLTILLHSNKCVGQKKDFDLANIRFPKEILIVNNNAPTIKNVGQNNLLTNVNIFFVCSMHNPELESLIAQLSKHIDNETFSKASLFLILQDYSPDKPINLSIFPKNCMTILDKDNWFRDMGLISSNNAMRAFLCDKNGCVEFFGTLFYKETLTTLKREIAKMEKKNK